MRTDEATAAWLSDKKTQGKADGTLRIVTHP